MTEEGGSESVSSSSSARNRPFAATEEEHYKQQQQKRQTEVEAVFQHRAKHSYWLTRIILIRFLAFIYFIAYLSLANQLSALIGRDGLLPATNYLDRVQKLYCPPEYTSTTTANINTVAPLPPCINSIVNVPTIFWFNRSDEFMQAMCYIGLALASFVMLGSIAPNAVLMFLLWAIYQSFVNIGQTWYGFGWESQLLETGFLAIFLVPAFDLRTDLLSAGRILSRNAQRRAAKMMMPSGSPPSRIVVWLYRWLLFRIMIGAGLIKVRHDQCWWDLTCLNYHYETQPLPNPLSWYLHQMPSWFHKMGVLSNHFIELVGPLLLFGPRRVRLVGGAIQIFFQIVLILSGNLSFLNWLTIAPAIMCFDDWSLSWMFPRPYLERLRKFLLTNVEEEEEGAMRKKNDDHHDGAAATTPPPTRRRRDTRNKLTSNLGTTVRQVVNISLFVLIAYLSINPIRNLLSPNQAMNRSFDPLHLVNTYGAFGSVGQTRHEVILEYTFAQNLSSSSSSEAVDWYEYEFKCKPGSVTRRPCIIAPYQLRIDWQIWFAAMSDYQHHPWLVHLVAKLLAAEQKILALLDKKHRDPKYAPGPGTRRPTFIRAELYEYKFTNWTNCYDASDGTPVWWSRKRVGSYLPPLSLNNRQLQHFLKAYGWPVPSSSVASADNSTLPNQSL